MKKVLEFIAGEMKKAGVEYHFEKNGKPKPAYPYYVGELVPTEPVNEDGMQQYSLILDGFTRKTESSSGTLFELLEDAEKIERHFPQVGGITAVLGNQAIAVFYCSCQPVDSGEEQLKKVQVILDVKTWKG